MTADARIKLACAAPGISASMPNCDVSRLVKNLDKGDEGSDNARTLETGGEDFRSITTNFKTQNPRESCFLTSRL